MVLNKTALKTCLSFGVNGLQERFMGKFQLKVKEIDFSNGNAPDHF